MRRVVEAAASEYRGQYDPEAFHAYDEEAARAIASQDMGRLRRAGAEYLAKVAP